MYVEAAFPPDGQAAELVQQGEGLLDDVAQLAETFDAGGFAFWDDRLGAAFAAGPAEGVAVVSLVREHGIEASSGPATRPGDRGRAVEQVDGSADVGHVRTAGEHVQRGAVAVADQVVLAPRLATVDRRRTCAGTPFFASM